ncbi:MAG: hypothetical protein ACI8ZM_005020 [Crocinitomix sp.]|jgi:hypothetical protein
MLRLLFTRIMAKFASSDYDEILTDKIERISRADAIIWNEHSEIYAKFIELNGYKFLSVTITGFLNIKTTEGCQLTFYTNTGEFSCKSESSTVEGDYSEISGIGLTKFDIELDADIIDFIETQPINRATLSTKNGDFPKTNLEFNYDSINLDLLKEILNS